MATIFEHLYVANDVEMDFDKAHYEFSEMSGWHRCGPETSRQIEGAEELGQEVTLTLRSFVSMKFVLKYRDGAGYKYFHHKHEGKSDCYRILCRPVARYEYSVEVVGVHKKTYTIWVTDGVTGERLQHFDFNHEHNIGYVRTEVARNMRVKGNAHMAIAQFIDKHGMKMNGRMNALKVFTAEMTPDVLEEYRLFAGPKAGRKKAMAEYKSMEAFKRPAAAGVKKQQRKISEYKTSKK
jgi:hypothetical protein